MSCCFYWVILDESLSVRVLASAVDDGIYIVLAKITIIMTTAGCFYAKSGDVAACRVVCIGLYLKSVWVSVF